MFNDEFSMALRRDGTTLSIVCSGDLDVAPAERLREAFEAGLEDGPECVVLDCDGITFLASAGITALVDIAVRCKESGIALALTLSPHARRVLDVVGLWWLGVVSDGIAIHESLQKALRVYAEESYSGNLAHRDDVVPPEPAT